jgi:hypothetical protein
MDNGDIKNLTEEEKIKLINEAYDSFSREIKKIEKERDEKIMAIIKKIDDRKLGEARNDITNN